MSDFRSCAYSFLYEESSLCDYEIATDELASQIGLAKQYVQHSSLDKILEWVYHANGSMRAKMAIDENDLSELNHIYDELLQKMGQCKTFVYPEGCKGACHLHCLRSKTKAIIRIMAKIDREPNREKKQILHDFFNLLSNTFFMMALLENKCENVTERVFKSKSYDC